MVQKSKQAFIILRYTMGVPRCSRQLISVFYACPVTVIERIRNPYLVHRYKNFPDYANGEASSVLQVWMRIVHKKHDVSSLLHVARQYRRSVR
jgi:hypothetical protein